MARLTAQDRRDLPSSAFAGPGRSFPITDPGHAQAALREIQHAPASARTNIRRRAEAMLGRGKPKGKSSGGARTRDDLARQLAGRG